MAEKKSKIYSWDKKYNIIIFYVNKYIWKVNVKIFHKYKFSILYVFSFFYYLMSHYTFV